MCAQAEKVANDGLDESDQPEIVPQAFDALRKVGRVTGASTMSWAPHFAMALIWYTFYDP